MKRCSDFEELIVELVYDDIDDSRRVMLEEHLAGCEACSQLVEEMRATLGVMSRRTRRDPGPEFWEGYWDRLVERMEGDVESTVHAVDEAVAAVETVIDDTTSQSWWRSRVGSPTMSWAYRTAAVAAVLVVGIFVGRTFFAPPTTTAPETAVHDVADAGTQPPADAGTGTDTGTDAGTLEGTDVAVRPVDDGTPATDELPPVANAGNARLASSNERAMCYVEKSQVLLIGLINNEPDADGYASGVGSQRARKLLDEAPAIKDDLSDPRQRRLRELVGELEKILVQIANLESADDLEEVEFIRGRVNQHDVLLKINLEQLRQESAADANCAAPTNSDAKTDPQKGTI